MYGVTHDRALGLADLLGGKTPVGALISLLKRFSSRASTSSEF